MYSKSQIFKRNLARRILQVSDILMGRPFAKMRRISQKTVSHCGPATVEMLVSFLSKRLNQDKFVGRTGASASWFKLHGLNVSEIATAVKRVFPEFQFWYKRESRISDLSAIVNKYGYPVGIEWQGVFDYEDNSDDPEYGEEDDDPGHYSVVTQIDTKRDQMRIADPERHYAGSDRLFKVSFFKKRWWDTNEIRVRGSKKTRKVTDYKMMFVITPKNEVWPKNIGMKKG